MEQARLAQFARCWPWLEPALRRGEQKDKAPGAVFAALEAGRAQLWAGEAAAAVTELLGLPEGRFCHCWLAGGDLAELMALRPGIEAWARAQGAEFTSIKGRNGWDRLLRSYGYQRVGGELLKDLR